MLIIGLTSSILFLTNNVPDTSGSFQEILSIANIEDVAIQENGNAHVSLTIDVADSAMVEMYQQMLATPTDVAVGEEIPIPENRTENGFRRTGAGFR